MAPRRQGATGEREAEDARGCCVPGECLRPREPVRIEDAVRVLCNNDTCAAGRYMHRECFEQWEGGVLAYLKSCGRARSWSERQRHQNLWTKKGYDLAFKACGCRCGRGHLKKDLDWAPPGAAIRAEEEKKRRRRTRSGRTPAAAPDGRSRAFSLSSSGSCSPPSAPSEPSTSPTHAPPHAVTPAKKISKPEIISDRIRYNKKPVKCEFDFRSEGSVLRAGAGANGIFSRRLDFSTFNLLPKHKVNSYQIKIEDEGNHGNDDTRLFILSTLAGQHKPRVSCALCKETLHVFDRYPLVDGTFFLSPRQHDSGAVEVKVEGRTQYLTCVCMGCLERCDPDRTIRCRFCGQKWDGSSLVLGTMYSYDIFMATPCCSERLKCNNCYKALLIPHQRLNYSDYSHPVTCPHCRVLDTHFVKPLSYCFTKRVFPLYQQWP
ncbi:headcase protein isoform X1 [Trichoplusia ni]|uniref:Headcase protein isoform X1 n=1 Tax=Trichoplusia ni TaxID=7111 RepID=A0A7E5VXZ9_TRINI|nr:headcase protein isoform X1 [Trichoplusia ni]